MAPEYAEWFDSLRRRAFTIPFCQSVSFNYVYTPKHTTRYVIGLQFANGDNPRIASDTVTGALSSFQEWLLKAT